MAGLINPGTGPVADATADNAHAAMRQFAADLRTDGQTVTDWKHISERDDQGRWRFQITVNGDTDDVEMPGLALERLRYLAEPGQNAFHFTRLYVDGKPWLWVHALNACT